jgi:hypothetical protein
MIPLRDLGRRMNGGLVKSRMRRLDSWTLLHLGDGIGREKTGTLKTGGARADGLNEHWISTSAQCL